MRAGFGDVLGDFGQEIQWVEYLEVSCDTSFESITGRIGELVTVTVFGLVNDLSVIRNLDHPAEAEWTSRNILDQVFKSFRVILGNQHLFMDTESGMPPASHLVDNILGDFLFLQQQSKPAQVLDI